MFLIEISEMNNHPYKNLIKTFKLLSNKQYNTEKAIKKIAKVKAFQFKAVSKNNNKNK